MHVLRTLTEDSGGPLDLVNGIPAHPLVVHAAVVLVPLAALGLLVMAVWPRFSRGLGWLVLAGAAVATLASWAAKESGEALEDRFGEPRFDHAELGEVMPAVAAGLLAVTALLWWVDRVTPADAPSGRRALRWVVAVLAIVVALGNLVWVVRVGDSGAKSVWSGRVVTAPASVGDEVDDD